MPKSTSSQRGDTVTCRRLSATMPISNPDPTTEIKSNQPRHKETERRNQTTRQRERGREKKKQELLSPKTCNSLKTILRRRIPTRCPQPIPVKKPASSETWTRERREPRSREHRQRHQKRHPNDGLTRNGARRRKRRAAPRQLRRPCRQKDRDPRRHQAYCRSRDVQQQSRVPGSMCSEYRSKRTYRRTTQ